MFHCKISRQVLAVITMGVSSAAFAEFPDKPITLVVPFAAGGPSDKIARDLAEALRKQLPQPIIIENSVGAGGTVGTARVAKARPNGYTILIHHIGFATAPALYKKLQYKTESDFAYLGLINEAPSTLLVRTSLPVNNFAELRKLIASDPGKLNMANAGVGSASHLCGLMLQSALGTQINSVSYKGTAPAMADLIGGQVDLMCEQATNSVPQIEGKKVRVVGVTSDSRMKLPALANVPTLAEQGLKGFNVSVWHGLYAPAGTPPEVLGQLNAALKGALKDADFIKRQEALGISVVTDKRVEPSEHRRFVESEIARWSGVIKAAGAFAE